MKITEIVLKAYELLLQYRIVEIIKSIDCNKEDRKKGWEFQCNIKIPYANPENISEIITVRVFIPECFPYAPVSFYPISEEIRCFPHQDAETGKLCLRDERFATCDEKKTCYLC